jgi:biotin operon repressor
VTVTGGVVTLNAAGNLVFTPNANYNGSPSFSYTLSDGNGGTSTGTVNGTVTPVNDAPVAAADTFTTAEDTATTIDVRANDSDVDGDTLSVTQVNGSAISSGGPGVAVSTYKVIARLLNTNDSYRMISSELGCSHQNIHQIAGRMKAAGINFPVRSHGGSLAGRKRNKDGTLAGKVDA